MTKAKSPIEKEVDRRFRPLRNCPRGLCNNPVTGDRFVLGMGAKIQLPRKSAPLAAHWSLAHGTRTTRPAYLRSRSMCGISMTRRKAGVSRIFSHISLSQSHAIPGVFPGIRRSRPMHEGCSRRPNVPHSLNRIWP